MIPQHVLAVARGDRPADLVLAGGRLADVFSGRFVDADLAIAGGRIAAIGHGLEGREVVELDGRCVAPGLIDAHVHVESALVPPAEFARAVVPRGVTTVITDPHEIANVSGTDGVRFMLREAEGVPLELFANAPSCVPATDLGSSGATLTATDLEPLLAEPRILGLAEVMNYPGVVSGDPALLAKLRAFRGRVIDGHCPAMSGRELDAYVAAGISSDHESTTLAEAREKLSRGLMIFIREATNARNLEELLPLVDSTTERRICFCTDDRQPSDLLDEGSIDHMLRVAIERGVDPFVALRLAGFNAAEHYRLKDRGAIAPGRRADLIVVPDLDSFVAEQVYIEGRKVAQEGRPLFEAPPPAAGTAVLDTMHLRRLDFAIPARGRERVRVIGLQENQLVTHALEMTAVVRDGRLEADPAADLLKMAVAERHRGTGNIGLGFVHGLGLERGAIAGTVLHDHHNLAVIGADDRSMRTAAEAVVDAGGGLAAAVEGELLAILPLPIGGLMSDRPIEEVRARLDELLAAAHALGSPLHDPFMAMSFLGLEVIPALKLTDRGLVDVERFELVPLRIGD